MNDHPWTIVHNTAAQRFETRVDGWLCRADYQVHGDVLHLVHTEVASAVEGRGIAGSLVRAALAWAEQQGYRVLPRCSFVRVYLQRHREYAHLVT
jgi:predicted GNAT family acetyltransferase